MPEKESASWAINEKKQNLIFENPYISWPIEYILNALTLYIHCRVSGKSNRFIPSTTKNLHINFAHEKNALEKKLLFCIHSFSSFIGSDADGDYIFVFLPVLFRTEMSSLTSTWNLRKLLVFHCSSINLKIHFIPFWSSHRWRHHCRRCHSSYSCSEMHLLELRSVAVNSMVSVRL